MKERILSMKTFYINISKETCDYLQRLHYEINTSRNVVTALLDQHKDDPDASVLTGVPFQTYHKKLEEAEYSYQIAKDELTKELTPKVQEHEGNENVVFDWNLEDFQIPQVLITINDGTEGATCGCCK